MQLGLYVMPVYFRFLIFEHGLSFGLFSWDTGRFIHVSWKSFAVCLLIVSHLFDWNPVVCFSPIVCFRQVRPRNPPTNSPWFLLAMGIFIFWQNRYEQYKTRHTNDDDYSKRRLCILVVVDEASSDSMVRSWFLAIFTMNQGFRSDPLNHRCPTRRGNL